MPPQRTPLERFLSKIELDEECWLWTGYVSPYGYGQFRGDGRNCQAHRWSYEHFVGPIPEGFDLHHRCRRRRCVNPAHVVPMTRREHMMLSDGLMGIPQRARTHCPHGHPYDEVNTYRSPRGARLCRACHNERDRAKRAQRQTNLRGAAQRARTHCPHGHPYDEANTYRSPRGTRLCRACHRERSRARWARLRAERQAA